MASPDLSAAAQRQRLLAALQLGPISTLDARRELCVMHPAARIQELRDGGRRIETMWSTEPDDKGVDHRVARYVLLPEQPKEKTLPSPPEPLSAWAPLVRVATDAMAASIGDLQEAQKSHHRRAILRNWKSILELSRLPASTCGGAR